MSERQAKKDNQSKTGAANVKYTKKNYVELKKKAIDFEKDNYTKLVAVRCANSGWWKLLGHSAVIYVYLIAPRLKIKPKLVKDTDYDAKSEVGVVSIPNIDTFTRRLETCGVTLNDETYGIRIYDLHERVSQQDYNMMLNEDNIRVEMTNKLINPDEVLVELNAKVKELLEIVHVNVRKMDGPARDAFGIDMEKGLAKLQIMIARVSRGTADACKCLEEAYDIAENLYGYISIFLNLRLFDAKVVYNITGAVVALEKQIRREIEKRAVVKAEDELMNKLKMGE